MLLVVGLGNPGREYARNRHNAGWMVVDELARRHSGSWRAKFAGQMAEIRVGEEKLALLKQADRAALYEKAQLIAKEEAPWITIAHSVRFDPVRKEVQGYKMDATAHHYFNNSDLAK